MTLAQHCQQQGNYTEAFANTFAEVSAPPIPANQPTLAVLPLLPHPHNNQLHLLFMGMS
jgi:hypothetical protein